MRFRDDGRAQTSQIGAILLFGALILAFASYQAFVVPDQNREIEFSQNLETQGQFESVRNVVVAAPGRSNGPGSVRLTLGATYPDRAIASNPGPATGTLRTVGTGTGGPNLTLGNVAATGSGAADFWNGSIHRYATGGLVYAPNYNLYRRAPTTVYENSVVYNAFRRGNRSTTGQTLIEGRRLTLVTLAGSLATTRAGSVTIDPEYVSASARELAVTDAAEVGLYYEYYEDEYGSVPAGGMPPFDPANRVATGGIATFDIKAVKQRQDDFAVRFSGTLDAPSDGQYTFATTSDDGSRLYIDGTEIVDNGGDHSNRTRSDTTTLTAGTHDITVTFYENDINDGLTVEWEPPGSSGLRRIPTGRLSNDRGVTAPGEPITLTLPTHLNNETWTKLLDEEFASNGGHVTSLNVRNSAPYEYYEAEYAGVTMPAFDEANLVRTGETANFDISKRDRDDDFAFRFNKRIRVPETGQYTFSTTSDDGSRLFIDGDRIVDNPDEHPSRQRTGTVQLRKGWHDITVTFFENGGTQSLAVEWQPPSAGSLQPIPDGVLADRQSKRLALELERNERYRLRMAKVGVGTGFDRPDAAYLTSVTGERVTVPENGTTDVVVEVRDRFNNPVPGVLVSANTTWDNSSLQYRQATTGADGRVTLPYEAPADIDGHPKSDRLRISTTALPRKDGTFDATVPENETVNVSVRNANGSGLTGGPGLAPAYEVNWSDPSATGDNPNAQLSACDERDCTWDVENSRDATLTLRAETTPTVDNGTLDFAVDDGTIATIRNVDPTDGEGNVTAELRARDNGTVAVFVASAGSSDRINVTVDAVTQLGLVYDADATARDYGTSAGTNRGLVDFNVTNTRDQPVTITAITIDDSTAGTGLSDSGGGTAHEVTFDSTGGFAESGSGFSFGTLIDLNRNESVAAGATTRVQLTEVVNASDQPVDMVGEELTVSLHYVIGGTQYTDTFDVKEIGEGSG